jgi:membrane protease YdiL (CAAX protease family)
VQGLIKVGLWVPPCLLATRLMSAGTWLGAADELGLRGSPSQGLWLGAVSTLPTLIAAAMVAAGVEMPWGAPRPVREATLFDWNAVLGSVITGPFAEEVLFRGFLVSQLRRTGLPALAVVLCSGCAFGLAHLGGSYYDSSLGGVQIVAAGIGGSVFAWMFLRWRSLWPAIGLHAVSNLWWTLSPPAANVAQGASLLVAAAITLRLRPNRPEAGRVLQAGATIE